MSRLSLPLLNRQVNWIAGLILALFLLLGIAYSLVIPPFETPDELFHYGFVRHIAAGNALPIQSTRSTGPWEQEGSQAPLFYLLAGWLSAPIDQSDVAAITVRNPYANIGSPLIPGNKNFMLYSARLLPLRGANLALHLARWLSLLAGVVTLYFTFLTAQLCFPKRTELALSMLFATAAIPQFAFIAASCSNDMLVTAACTVVVYQLAYFWQNGAVRQGYGRWLLLGITLGIAALTKLQSLGVIGLSGLTLLLLAWTERNWKQFLSRCLLVGVPLLALAGWWYARNYLLYGDLLGTGNLTALNGSRNGPLTWSAFVDEFRGVRYSFWGLFGWFSIPLPGWFYTGIDLFSLLGLIGVLLSGILSLRKQIGFKLQSAEQNVHTFPVILLLGFWIAISFALLVYWMSQAMGGQGRLIFPAIGAIMIVLIVGIDAWLGWLPGRWRMVVNWIIPSLLFAISLYSVVILLPSSYHPATPVASIPTEAQPVNFRYSDPQDPDVALALQAIELPVKRVKADATLPLTLYWRSDTPLKQDYPIFIQLLDEVGREVTNLTSHPGWGRNPTSLWLPNTFYPDHYELTIHSPIDNRSPLLARLYTGFIRPGTESIGNLPLTAFDADGNEITPFADSVVIEPTVPASIADLQDAKAIGSIFGGVLQLEAVSWSIQPAQNGARTLNVTLLWRATGTPATDYTAYVHLLDTSGTQVGGVDHPPAGERLPTHYWQANDTVLDAYELTLSSGSSQVKAEIWVGLYESGSGGALRLPVTDAANQPSGDGVVKIGEVGGK
ncbi:MAG: DUF2142 domain-containing protein [Caldilineaceae bacterium]